MSRLSPFLALAILSCATAPRPPPERPLPPPPAPRERGTVAEKLPDLAATAAKIRGLPFTRPVTTLLYGDAEVRGYIDQKVAGTSREKWDLDRRVLRAFELIGDDVPDLSKAVGEAYGAQVAGFYDDERDVLVLRETAGASFPGVDPEQARGTVLVHELVHALQAQHLGLREKMRSLRPEDSERAEAYPMLVEGDASLAMIQYMAPQLSLAQLPPLVRMMRSAQAAGLAKVPPWLRETMVARYLDGLVFCAALQRTGGWDLVNKAFAKPPATTEQVLHPEKYFAGELPAKLALPEAPGLLGHGFNKLVEREMGELGIRIWAGLWLNANVGAEAAAGWDGDRYALWAATDGADALVWATAWDGDADAVKFERIASAIESRRGRESHSAGVRVYPRGLRADAVLRKGRVVAVVRDAPADLVVALAQATATKAFVKDEPPVPPFAGLVYKALPGDADTRPSGHPAGRRWIDETLGFAVSRPEKPAFEFVRGPTASGVQRTPLVMTFGGGEVRLEVHVLPAALPPKDLEQAAAQLARGYAEKTPGGEGGGAVEKTVRGDKREAYLATFHSEAGSGRVLAVAAKRHSYVLVALWAPNSRDDAVHAVLEAQSGFEVLEK